VNTDVEEFVPVVARVRPVMMPIGQLDERLCIALVGWSDAHGHWARAVSAKPLACLPNEVGHAMFSFGSLIASDFIEWCNKGRSADLWVPPLGGLITGEWMEVEGFDFEDTVRVSMSLAGLSSAQSVAEPRGEEPAVAPRTSDESRFLDAVRAEVQRTRPGLAKGFRRMLSLTGKAATGEIDFVGHHYVTCYAAVNPKGRSAGRVQTASAALWRLARARDAFGFASPAAIELTAWIPPPGLPIFTAHEYRLAEETVAELRAQADKEHLSVFSVIDVAAACRRLVDLEIDKAPLHS
jgi:hypothetical protein